MAYRDHYAIRTPTDFGKGHKSRRYRRFLEEALPYLKTDKCTVLDLRAGHGEFARGCKDKKFEFYGIEPNNIMFQMLKDEGFNIIQDDIPPIPFENDKFDMIFCGYILECLPSPEAQYHLILECRRVLKSGGILLIVSRNFMRQKKFFYENSYTIINPTTQRRIHQLLFDTNFRLIKSKFIAGNFFGPSKFLAYIFYTFYNYAFWDKLFGMQDKLNSIFFKIRVSFPESIIAIGQKEG